MRLTRLTLAVALALLTASCSQAPTTDIETAKQALDNARNAQAAEYAPDAWNAAQDALAKLDAEMNAQEKTWSVARSYSNAKQLAIALKDDAERATRDAQNGKEKAKVDADGAMQEARKAYDDSKEALASAPRGKGTEADLASLKSDAASIESTLQEMQQAYDAGDYKTAIAKAKAASDAAHQVRTEIDQAKARRRAA